MGEPLGPKDHGILAGTGQNDKPCESFRLRIYEKEEFRGQMMEFTKDCPQVNEKFAHHEIPSCNVLEGHWIFYEQPNYRGRQYYLRPGEYRRCTEWKAETPRVDSFKRLHE
ncbi:gamma-crystallin 1-like [Hyla sarda]|uniref:gamma-crystallin 1-like n=1 Tax=Hyla sarda TaxID=327740 RepID=UPI0024C4149B|nr:gamma-crystallin 1-like [Hyla sarda]